MLDTVGVIGTGAMGGAVAKLIHASQPETVLYLSNRTVEKAEALAKELHEDMDDDE